MTCTWPEPSVWKFKPSLKAEAKRNGTYLLEKITYVPTPVRANSTFGYEHRVQAQIERDALRRGLLRLKHINARNLWVACDVVDPARKAGRMGASGRNYLRAYLPPDWWAVFDAVILSIDRATGNCLPNVAEIAAAVRLGQARVRQILGLLRQLGVLKAWRTRHGAAYTVLATGFRAKDSDDMAPYTGRSSVARGWVRDNRWVGPGTVVPGWKASEIESFISNPGKVLSDVVARGCRALESGSTDRTATVINVTSIFASESNKANTEYRHRSVVRRAVDAGMGGEVASGRISEALQFVAKFARGVLISDRISDHELRHLLAVNCGYVHENIEKQCDADVDAAPVCGTALVQYHPSLMLDDDLDALLSGMLSRMGGSQVGTC